MNPAFFAAHPALACAVLLTSCVPLAVVYMGQPVKLDHLWAAACLLGAVYFTFRG